MGIVGNQHAPLCGRFHSNSSAVARYGRRIRVKSTANCDVHLAPFSRIVADKQLK
ncbi:hypothetical protein RO865_15680 [Blautia faecis]|nr:hypothetical protein [Blautia faecis]